MQVYVQQKPPASNVATVVFDEEIYDIIQEGVDAFRKGKITLPATILDNPEFLIKLNP